MFLLTFEETEVILSDLCQRGAWLDGAFIGVEKGGEKHPSRSNCRTRSNTSQFV